MADLAIAADRAGVDRIVVSDHVVMGERLDAYADPSVGGTEGGRQPTGPDGQWLEPLTTLTWLAAQTSSVRLGTNILLAALRRPVVLAKTLATLDVLSGGRVDLGVGVGWQREEYEAAGLVFADRGRLLDHTLEVCQALWSGGATDYESPELSFERVHCSPTPIQDGGIPIWVSGTVNPRAMRRLARFGSGWIPWGPAVADPIGAMAEMRAAVAEHGRDPLEIQVTAYAATVKDSAGMLDTAATAEGAAALCRAGATDIKLSLRVPSGVDAGADYLRGVVEAFREATSA